MTGFVRERSGASLPGIVPSNTYTTRDGKYVVIGANGDAIFRRMMTAIGREDLGMIRLSPATTGGWREPRNWTR